MATSTFDRKIELKDEKSIKKLVNILTEKKPEPFSGHIYSDADRKRGELLLNQYLSRSKH